MGDQQAIPGPRRKCGTMQVHFRLLEDNPGYRQKLASIEDQTARRRTSPAVALAAGPIVIPVVVHVVYKNKAENISVSQIKSQIAALNKDYRAKNPDKSKVPGIWKGLVADTRLEFSLATRDPEGKLTSGITRTKTTRDSFSDDNSVKFADSGGKNAWPSDRYLNIWVCTLADGLLGYAQFPSGPAATDGVVILNTAFGTKGTAAPPFNLGRTATHEIGHWLNLRHIWGDVEDCSGTDFVDDTPNAQHPNRDKPVFPRISCANGPNGDMFMNYMDYVDDDTMVMFTPGQVARMDATLDSARHALGQPR